VIWWAGKCSNEIGVVVERYPNQNGPERRLEVIQIPGRNGDLIIDSGVYNNYAQSYEVYFNASKNRTPKQSRMVREWLQTATGYQRLEDSYDPEFYRLAYFSGPAEIENIMNQYGRMTISFMCKPQRWRKDGETPLLLTASQTIYNELFPALPLIKINGTGAGNLYVGGYTVEILSLDEYVMLDSDTQNAYKGTLNKNSTISAPEFPVLQSGDNVVDWDGNITSIEITPRWWTV
jgi:putative phage tail component